MENKKIFFIEDENEIIELYNNQLEKEGYLVESFNSGSEALVKINSIVEDKSSPPTVIILDLLLRDVSGLAVLGELRNKPIFDKTLVIILTNYVSESLKEQIKQMDNVEYLSKADVSPVSLIDFIKCKVV